jgi:hypothetical protein
MSFIKRKLTEFFYRCESINPQIVFGENDPSSPTRVRSPLIDRLIPKKKGAVYIIYGVDLNSDDRRHAHCTGLYKRHTPEGSLYCVERLDDERRVGGRLEQFYYVLSSLGLGGCKILPSEEDLDKFDGTEKKEKGLYKITISNDSIKFNNTAIISRWLSPDFGFYGNESADAVNFKPDGNPVIAVMKTLDGRDSIRVRPPELLVAIRDSLESSSLVLNGNYEKYMARLSLVQR